MLKKRWLAVIAICLSIFLILALVKTFQIRAAIAFGESFPEPSETVEFQSVVYSTWRPQIKVSGEIRAPREVELRNEVAGVIAKIGFVSGASLKKGDLLLQLDIAEEQAQLSALKPQIELAEKDFERLSGINNSQAISQQLIDQARSQRGMVRGQAASITESISNKTSLAPFAGTSGLHDFEVGEYIAADTMITRLIGNTDELWIDFDLPQQYGKISIGETIIATAPEIFEGQRNGQVSVIAPAFSRATRSLAVRAVIANPNKAIMPGSFVTVSAPIGTIQTIIRIPSTAVRFDSFGSYVFSLEQVEQQWRARRKPVTVLAKEEYQTVLKNDLAEGTLISTVGAYKLREGLLVNLSGDDAAIKKTENISPSAVIEILPAADDVRTEVETPTSQAVTELAASSQLLEQNRNRVSTATDTDPNSAPAVSETPTADQASPSE